MHASSIDSPVARTGEQQIARLLARGALLIVALVTVGSVLLVAAGRTPAPDAPGPSFDLGRLAGDLVALRPEGVLWLGLGLTVLLPAVRVLAAFLLFRREGDLRHERVALGVLSMMALAVGVALLIAPEN